MPCKNQCGSADSRSCGRVDDKCLAEYKTDLFKALNFTEIRTKRSSNFWDYHDRGSANINNRLNTPDRGSTKNNNYLNYPDQDFNDLWRRVRGQHTITIYSPNNINNPILNVYYTGSDTRRTYLGITTGSDTRIIRAVSANITIRHIGGRYTPFGNSLDDRMRVMQAWGYGNNNQPTDERGHIIASQLGGLNEWYNLIPMSPSLNRNYGQNRGWVNEENFIRRFFENCPSSIFMRVVLAYDDNSNRPYGLRLNWAAIDDEGHFSLPFDYFYRQ